MPFLAGALSALSIAALALPASAFAAVSPDSTSQFLSLLNADRQAAGLAPLAVDSTLSSIAAQRAQQELASGTLSHYDSSGNLVFQSLLSSSGVQYTSAGENLAENNYPLTQSVTQANSALLASPTHAANILNTGYNAVGVAIAGPGPNGQYYYVEIFGQLPQGASTGTTTTPTTPTAPINTTATNTSTTNTTATNTTATTQPTTTSTQEADDDDTAEAAEHHAKKELEKAEKLEERAEKLERKAAKLEGDDDDERGEHLQQRALRLEDEAKRLEATAQRLQQLAAKLNEAAKSTATAGEKHEPKGCAFGNGQAEGQTATAPGCTVARKHREGEEKRAFTAPTIAPALTGAGAMVARQEAGKAAKAIEHALLEKKHDKEEHRGGGDRGGEKGHKNR